MTWAEWMFCASIPIGQMLGLVVLGLIFRVDRKPKGGDHDVI